MSEMLDCESGLKTPRATRPHVTIPIALMLLLTGTLGIGALLHHHAEHRMNEALLRHKWDTEAMVAGFCENANEITERVANMSAKIDTLQTQLQHRASTPCTSCTLPAALPAPAPLHSHRPPPVPRPPSPNVRVTFSCDGKGLGQTCSLYWIVRPRSSELPCAHSRCVTRALHLPARCHTFPHSRCSSESHS